jgi:HEAT repeat protein
MGRDAHRVIEMWSMNSAEGSTVPMKSILSIFIVFMILVWLPSEADAQLPDHAEIERVLAKGSVEQKRDTLSFIRSSADPNLARLALKSFDDKNPIVRASAIAAAENSPNNLLVPALAGIFKDKSLLVRKEVADALGRIDGDDRVPSILVERLRQERDREVRAAIINAIGLTGSMRHYSILIDVLTTRPSEANEFERAMAARAMGQIARRGRGESPALSIPSSFNAMALGPFPKNNPEIKSLSEFSPFESQVISLLLAPTESPNVKRECAFLIGEAGGRASFTSLLSFVEHEDPHLARIARESLQTLIARSEAKLK